MFTASIYRYTDTHNRGATTAEKLRGPRFGSQHRGTCAPRPAGQGPGWVLGVGGPRPLFAVRVRFPEKNENSDAKSCILVTSCCEIPCFLKTTSKKLGRPIHCWSPQPKSWGPVSPGPYGYCATSVHVRVRSQKTSCPLTRGLSYGSLPTSLTCPAT